MTLSGVIRRASAEERRNRDRRITSDRDVSRKPLTFRADAGHCWNLNRYSTGRNQLLGSIVSIQMWSTVHKGYPFYIDANGSKRKPRQTTHAKHPPRQRLSCVLGMLSSLEVKVLCPT